MNPQQQQMFMQ
jgi:hypothetical protein